MDLSTIQRRVNERTTALLKFQLVDEDGAPINPSSLDAFTLDLYLASDATTFINSRQDQDVLNANNVTVQSPLTITGATQASPVVITAASHGLRTGDTVKIASVGGMTEINDRIFTVTKVSDDTFSLDDEDGTSHTTYTTGGTAATGMVTWTMQPADNAIVGGTAVGSYEEHIALFQWTYDTTKKGNEQIQIDVLSQALVP